MRICSLCQGSNEDGAVYCRHCGKRIPDDTPARRKLGLILFLGLLGAIALLAILFSQRDPGIGIENPPAVVQPTATEDVRSAFFAYQMCKEFVSDRLKAPRTADYPAYLDAQIAEYQPGYFAIDAYVDAENSFGAMIRTNFICKVKYAGEGRWKLEELLME